MGFILPTRNQTYLIIVNDGSYCATENLNIVKVRPSLIQNIFVGVFVKPLHMLQPLNLAVVRMVATV